jgi:hypothetical protein
MKSLTTKAQAYSDSSEGKAAHEHFEAAINSKKEIE